MTALFTAVVLLLTLLVVAWMVRPLLRPAPPTGVSSQHLNAGIYRDQLQTLAQDLARGAISPADYETTRDELQLRLLDDTAPTAPPPSSGATFWTARRTSAALALVLPLGAVAMYGWLGAPHAMDSARTVKAEQDSVTHMVEGLAARLQAQPDNPQGWAMLARSYKVMGRLDEAEQAYARVGPLLDTSPDLLADYADLLAARADGQLEGRPMALVNKALALNPAHPLALMLAGTAAYRKGHFSEAANHWENLRTGLPPGSSELESLQSYIADARSKAPSDAAARPRQAPASSP